MRGCQQIDDLESAWFMIMAVFGTRYRLSSTVDEGDAPQLIINELLAYVYSALQCIPCGEVCVAVRRHYAEEEICVAKRLLWETFPSRLPAFKNRQDSSNRKALDVDVEDIVGGIANLDAAVEGSKEPNKIFVARDVFNAPPRPPLLTGSNNFADDRLEVLEKELNEMKSMLARLLSMNSMSPMSAPVFKPPHHLRLLLRRHLEEELVPRRRTLLPRAGLMMS